jgi:hypothetical protein
MKIIEAINRLNRYYFKGDIIYPRVTNNYLGSVFDMFPHPPLEKIDFYTLPLLNKNYPINDKTLFLYLHHKGLVLPSNIWNTNKFLKTVFYTDKKRFLEPLNKKYINETLSKFMDFCEKEKITPSSYRSHVISKFPQKPLYVIKLKPTPVNVKVKKELKKEKAKNNFSVISMKLDANVFLDNAKSYEKCDNFFEGLEKFKKKRKLYNFVLNKC